MRPWERRLFFMLHLIVAVTGFGYLYLKYFTLSDASFAVIQHPWQSPTIAVHIVAAAVFMVFFGIMLRSHIIPKLRRLRPENRLTGLISLATFIIMALSGYFLQVASTLWMIQIWSWTHIITGSLFSVTYTLHIVLSRRMIKMRQQLPSIE